MFIFTLLPVFWKRFIHIAIGVKFREGRRTEGPGGPLPGLSSSLRFSTEMCIPQGFNGFHTCQVTQNIRAGRPGWFCLTDFHGQKKLEKPEKKN